MREWWTGRSPEFPIEGHRVVVVPLADASGPGRTTWYYDSGLGREIAQRLEDSIRVSGIDVDLVDGGKLEQAIGNFAGPDDQVPWDRSARELGVDYLISGQITEFRVGDPRTVGFYPGVLVFDIIVRDVARGAVVFRRRVAAKYPKGEIPDADAPIRDSPEMTRSHLIARVGSELEGVFCGIWRPKP